MNEMGGFEAKFQNVALLIIEYIIELKPHLLMLFELA